MNQASQQTAIQLSAHSQSENGFCYPDWYAIAELVDTKYAASEQSLVWRRLVCEWLEQIKVTLGGDYALYETSNFFLLSEAPPSVIKNGCKFFEETLQQILCKLEGVAADEGEGKHVVLMFADDRQYLRYISHFLPDGESPMSGGVCLSGGGYIHQALLTEDYSSYRSVFVHELTHSLLTHLPIPPWVNEALAMRMEEMVCDENYFHLDHESYQEHVEYWCCATIQEFWSGESWKMAGEGFDLSDELAMVLWRKIEKDLAASPDQITAFLFSANASDAGQAAFQKVFGYSLFDLVADFLGEGNWTPAPSQWSVDGSAVEIANPSL